jgi:hypothetical protein
MVLTTHPLLTPRSSIGRAIPLPPLSARLACNGTAVTLRLNFESFKKLHKCTMVYIRVFIATLLIPQQALVKKKRRTSEVNTEHKYTPQRED